jgi:hypothetical protein
VGTATGTVIFSEGEEEIGNDSLEDGTEAFVTDRDGDEQPSPGDDAVASSAPGVDGGDPPYSGSTDGTPGPCQALPHTGNRTGIAAAVGFAGALLGVMLLAMSRSARQRTEPRRGD